MTEFQRLQHLVRLLADMTDLLNLDAMSIRDAVRMAIDFHHLKDDAALASIEGDVDPATDR